MLIEFFSAEDLSSKNGYSKFCKQKENEKKKKTIPGLPGRDTEYGEQKCEEIK